ncbi:MAG TPA: OsmC family protein [Methanomassiliicoccales archaeon]|nr:OsmC family protein [Methanomassiliicoccales archaeon]
MQDGEFKTTMELVEKYKFLIHFDNDKVGDIYMDEPAPLGSGEHPNAGKFLAAAIGNCLCASLSFCVRRHRAEMLSLSAEVFANLVRNERGRYRIDGIRVEMHPQVSDPKVLERCREMFEDFCIVTASIREGIPVDVKLVTDVTEGRPQ